MHYSLKMYFHVDGSIDKYKTKLVIKGYKQIEGLDYFDTYSPMTRINSIRMMLTIAALRKPEVYEMDVKTTFLNEDLDEEIYMEQLKGFEGGITCQKQRKKKKSQQTQGPLRASNLVLYQREGAGLPCVGFKNRSIGRGNEDRSEPSPRFASNGIHMKSGANNLQGNSLGRSLGVNQVSIPRGSQNPIS